MATTSGGSYLNRQTPGVYIQELDAFPPSVVGVATAVPIFIGYTEFAGDPANEPATPLYDQAIALSSAADYANYFGGPPASGSFALAQQIQLFYANGGANCFVVSVGSYWEAQSPVTAPDPVPGDWTPGMIAASALLAGLAEAAYTAGATMIVVPEAAQLDEADYAAVVQAMMTQAGSLQDRVAILDLPQNPVMPVPPPPAPLTPFEILQAAQTQLWNALAPVVQYASYGAAYAPALTLADGSTAVASGVMAGIWTLNDASRGVWNAPANMAVAGVTGPAYLFNDAEQGEFNVPLNGMAINVLRSMANRGTVVWGARTLDGNSLDWRYIQVRRTITYINSSIKQSLQQFAFAANDGATWASVTAMVSNFLAQLWQEGGLMGDKASDAFTVQCGVPTTMSGQDVLNGYMIVNVTVQMIHPAEFIELTYTQTMQGV